MPKGAAKLLCFARRIHPVHHVRPDFWLVLLEHGGRVHFLQHGVADARGNVSHERQRPDRAAIAGQYERRESVFCAAYDHAPVCRREAQWHDRAAGDLSDPRRGNHSWKVAGFGSSLRRDAIRDGPEFCVPLQVRQSGLEAHGRRVSRRAAPGCGAACAWYFYFHADKEPDHCGHRHVWRVPAHFRAGLGGRLSVGNVGGCGGHASVHQRTVVTRAAHRRHGCCPGFLYLALVQTCARQQGQLCYGASSRKFRDR